MVVFFAAVGSFLLWKYPDHIRKVFKHSKKEETIPANLIKPVEQPDKAHIQEHTQPEVEKLNSEEIRELVRATPLPTVAPAQPQINRLEETHKLFMKQWNVYKQYAWGYDYLKPLSGVPENIFNCSISMFEALDTLILLDEKDEVQAIEEHIKSKFNGTEINLTGTGLSSLYIEGPVAGLLSAHYLLGKETSYFLQAALALFSKFPRISTAEIIYTTYISWDETTAHFGIFGDAKLDSHVQGSGPLELLSVFNLRPALSTLPARALSLYKTLTDFSAAPGLVYDHFLAYTAEPIAPFHFSLFANESSFYPNFAKIPYLTNHSADLLLDVLDKWQYKISFDFVARKENHVRLSLRINDTRGHVQNIRTASTPSTLIYASKLLPEPTNVGCRHLATDIMSGFLETLPLNSYLPPYEVLTTHLEKSGNNDQNGQNDQNPNQNQNENDQNQNSNQNSNQNPNPNAGWSESDKMEDVVINASWDFYPEMFESLYMMYRETGETKYQEEGWKIIQAMNQTCWGERGFHSLGDSGKEPKDSFNPSFFSAFKYAWLLFGGKLPEGEWVFNARGHLLKPWEAPRPDLKPVLETLPKVFDPEQAMMYL